MVNAIVPWHHVSTCRPEPKHIITVMPDKSTFTLLFKPEKLLYKVCRAVTTALP